MYLVSFAADAAILPQVPIGMPGAPLTYPLQHMGAGGNAIAQAASQAIAATQQLVPGSLKRTPLVVALKRYDEVPSIVGRRTSSLKASYEAINLRKQAHEFTVGSELAGAAQSAVAAIQLNQLAPANGGPPSKSQKAGKYGSNFDTCRNLCDKTACYVSAGLDHPWTNQALARCWMWFHLDQVSLMGMAKAQVVSLCPESKEVPKKEVPVPTRANGPMTRTSPRYCICNQVSYGEMVACDNDDVSIVTYCFPFN